VEKRMFAEVGLYLRTLKAQQFAANA
jgi:hypothetical protein